MDQEHTPDERRRLFAMGFGDGAKASYTKHKSVPSYMDGYHAGRLAKGAAIRAYCDEHGLPLPSPLR